MNLFGNCSIYLLCNNDIGVSQHYPLYRVSDAMCTGVDKASLDEQYLLFRERYDVISKDASKKVKRQETDYPAQCKSYLLCPHLVLIRFVSMLNLCLF